MALFIVADDLVVTSIVQHRQLLHLVDDLLNPAVKFFLAVDAHLAPLALELAPQHVGQNLGDALAAPPREFTGQPLCLRILDVQCHGRLSLFFLFIFILYSKQPLKNGLLS